ncbi:MAG: hypothetical protein R3F30_01610 [Planctomycetota bacterium]
MAARRRGADTNLIDAVDRLTRADRLTRNLEGGGAHLGNAIHVLPALHLMRAQLLQGKGELARSTGNTHRTHLMGVPLEQDPALMLRFEATLGEACLRAALEAGNAEEAEGVDREAARNERLDEARRALTAAHKAMTELAGDGRVDVAALRKAAGADFDPAKVYTTWHDVELWQGKPAGAVIALARGAAVLPQDAAQALAAQMCETAQERTQGAIAVRELARLAGDDAAMRWFLARARFIQSLEERKDRKTAPALASVRASRADFEKAVADSPGFDAGTRIWLAYTWLAEGALAFEDRQLDEAGDAMIKALEATVDAAGATDFSGWTTKTYLEAIGGRHYQAGTLDKGVALLDRALNLLPADAGLLNNKAFLLREQGVRKARSAPDEARKLFEASWETYKKAVTHSPEDVRLLNDTALIDVHYLHRDKDGSRAILERAIELGDKQLRDQPPATDDERKPREEAIGDACMNLGKLLLEQFDDPAGARKALEKSKDYWRPSHADVRALLGRVERREQGDGKDGKDDKDGGDR